METQNLYSLKSVTRTFGILALLCFAALSLIFISAERASASGGGSGGGSGSGSCSISYDKQQVSWSTFWGEVNGKTCGNTYLNNGKTRGDVNERCKSNRSTVVYVWYLRATNYGNEWVEFPSNAVTTNSQWKNFIDNGSGSSRVKSVAKSKVYGDNRTHICVWQAEVSTECGDITRPTVGTDGVTGLAVWYGTRGPGTDVPSSQDDSTTEIRNYCFVNCPTYNSTDSIRKWVIKNRSYGLVPSGSYRSSDSSTGSDARGKYCFKRPDVVQDRTTTAVRSTSGTTNDDSGLGYEVSGSYPYAWVTEVLWGTEAITGDASRDWDPSNADGPDLGNRKASRTSYGDIVDRYNDSTFGSADESPSQEEVDAALSDDAAADHPDVTLGDRNQKVIARGGVVTAVERTMYSSLSERRTKVFECGYTYTYRWTFRVSLYENYSMNSDDIDNRNADCSTSLLPDTINDSNKDVDNYGDWSGTDVDVDVYSAAQTPKATAAWQSLAAHCNSTGYTGASPGTAANGINTPIAVVDNDDSTKLWSGSSRTATLKDDQAVNNLVWGEPGTVASKKSTDRRGLFDKECAFNGVAAGGPRLESSTTHFRNNDFALGKATVDLFVPRNEGAVVKYAAEPALSTTVTRWVKGTPYVNGVTPAGAQPVGGNFRMAADPSGSSTKMFFSSDTGAAKGQKNFSVDPFATVRSGLVAGQVNVFHVASTWPSQKLAPQVLTFKYEYAPQVFNTFATTLGFDENSDQEYENNTVAVAIQGKVYAKPGATTSPAVNSAIGLDMFAKQRNSTGSSLTDSTKTVSNTADSNELPFGSNITDSKWNEDPRATSAYYRVIRFVRATTE